MASNPYVNKVVYDNRTLMDITDTTATASDVASGKYFYGADGSKTLGTASGGNNDINGLIQRTISGSYYNSEITGIGVNAFNSCYSLTSVDFPNVRYIANYAFSGCTHLTNVSIPNVLSIGSYAFYRCNLLNEASFPNVTTIGNFAFSSCTSLFQIYMPNVSSIGSCAFYHCSNLKSIDAPLLKSIESSTFTGCGNLESINVPIVSIIYASALYQCSRLSQVDMPGLRSIALRAFGNCTRLKVASFINPSITRIETYAFEGCISLESIYFSAYFEGELIRGIPRLMASQAFNSTPIANSTYLGYYGSIYVPSSALDLFKSSSYWSYYSDRMVGY